jgi:tRNA modification GTPase
MTGKGTGAISTVQLFGDSAEAVLKKIFRYSGVEKKFQSGTIHHGTIVEADEVIDEVVIGCEGADDFAINCHGNLLIVEKIMKLLVRYDVTPLTSEELLCKILTAENPADTIATEAKLTQIKSKTLQGTKIIMNQIDAGLTAAAKNWLKNINAIPLDEIKTAAGTILASSQTAKLIVFGCTIIIAGPVNTGKSTLLNCLAGKPKAVVADIKGTTRDWISAECRLDPLSVTLFDTAGLCNERQDVIGKISQEKTIQLLEKADLVLVVLDNSIGNDAIDERLLKRITGKKTLTVLNKSDLPAGFDVHKLPESLSANSILISAKFGTGIENLLQKIKETLGVVHFNLKQPICFTDRQENLLKQIQKADSKKQAIPLITELLNGRLNV